MVRETNKLFLIQTKLRHLIRRATHKLLLMQTNLKKKENLLKATQKSMLIQIHQMSAVKNKT
jgi:hypothetical protein